MMIMDHASGDSDGAHLAIDSFLNSRELLSNAAENATILCRARLVDVLQRPV